MKSKDVLGGKPPGWYDCEVKYLTIISLAPGMPRCKSNGRGKPKLCEPDLAASLLLWMSKSTTRMAQTMAPNGTSQKHWDIFSKYMRNDDKLARNNKPKTCARVDTAIRMGIATYKLKLRGSKRFKRYKKSTGASRASNDEAE